MILPDTWHNVGSKIRYLRKANRLTLKQLARGCDLSANTISMVERSEVSPTIETICKIAHALGVSPSSLFLEICHTEVVLQRASEDPLDEALPQQTLRTLSCAAHRAARTPQATALVRFSILCLSGQVELELDGQTYLLEPGDNLAFNSDAYHRWHRISQTTGIAVLVLSG